VGDKTTRLDPDNPMVACGCQVRQESRVPQGSRDTHTPAIFKRQLENQKPQKAIVHQILQLVRKRAA
jgi:hypothetical protein